MLVAIGGFLAGYVVGAKAGEAGLRKLSESWQVIQSSDEFKAAVSLAGGFVQQRVASNVGGTASSLVEGIMEALAKRTRLRVVS